MKAAGVSNIDLRMNAFNKIRQKLGKMGWQQRVLAGGHRTQPWGGLLWEEEKGRRMSQLKKPASNILGMAVDGA